jgi:hypothetical protein
VDNQEAKSKEILSKAIEGKLTRTDLKVWHAEGHLILHWLRNQFERLA